MKSTGMNTQTAEAYQKQNSFDQSSKARSDDERTEDLGTILQQNADTVFQKKSIIFRQLNIVGQKTF
ncbi:MAG: hypothetical protein Q4D24_00135 [Erysipelotrichaceae bacterium]|nr:hypothetical protein [Erysipelotrichaceae bacterium]